MATTSTDKQLEKICSELQELSLRRQQLNHRMNLLEMLKEFRQNAGFTEEVMDSSEEEESEKIAEELKNLTNRKKELQRKKDELEGNQTYIADDINKDGCDSPTVNQIFFVETPPPFPAPQVVLDIEKLPPRPSPTQCPYCQQYITTETSTVTGNTAWLVCLVCTFVGCIAGCCLLPFCTKSFKDVIHKCPKCRSHIHTCKKL
ncbi:U11/U12 small nuclear ribonucleoprotein 25 kDa protein isoform X1 [Hoplias malabaricus]|uniref:U11/U12 small nuclear ribonucleoprotein 25 kDa protein isoform X1 n=1 Tax=Hoplias malabaricus TaxID=27720 RepID=UPI0034627E47